MRFHAEAFDDFAGASGSRAGFLARLHRRIERGGHMAQDLSKSEPRTVPTRSVYEPFTALRTEMDRVFDAFLGRGFGQWPGLSGVAAQATVVPSLDVKETATELVVEAELPGLDEKDIAITLNNGVLTIKGEKKSEHDETKGGYHIKERSYGSFQRALQLGDGVDFDKAKALFEKGVLKVTLPKRAEAVAAEKRIPIGKGA
jgi:HSP20 family protein